MAVNSPHSPRQKMINVMYLVFIAMLALNVSVEVLDGFKTVDDSLKNSSATLFERNKLIMDELIAYNEQNPEKAGEWYEKGVQVRTMSDSIIDYIQALKLRMVREADGKNGDLNDINHKDDLSAASVVMLSPINGEGAKLRASIDRYREIVINNVTDSSLRSIIEKNLSTESISSPKSWEVALFEQMPLTAAITMLTKIENDIRSSEGEALANILNNVGGSDVRVNRLNAYLIPESDIVMKGGNYNARVILAAEDTTRSPAIFVGGVALTGDEQDRFSIPALRTGTFPVEGHVEMKDDNGVITRHAFSSSYTVIEPMASIAPILTNVLYAGIDNEISISVPGMAPDDVQATMDNGTLTRRGNRWVAHPTKLGQNTVINVTVRTADGVMRRMATQEFRVRPLPDPTPYISYTDAGGHPAIFKGGALSKSVLMNSDGIEAAIDDGILNVPFQVKSFRTIFFDSMGNAIPEISNGNHFSDRQKEQIRRLSRGNYFYISGVQAAGPDGTEREIAVMEVRVQ